MSADTVPRRATPTAAYVKRQGCTWKRIARTTKSLLLSSPPPRTKTPWPKPWPRERGPKGTERGPHGPPPLQRVGARKPPRKSGRWGECHGEPPQPVGTTAEGAESGRWRPARWPRHGAPGAGAAPGGDQAQRGGWQQVDSRKSPTDRGRQEEELGSYETEGRTDSERFGISGPDQLQTGGRP